MYILLYNWFLMEDKSEQTEGHQIDKTEGLSNACAHAHTHTQAVM